MAGSHGGYRVGSGRKPGTKNRHQKVSARSLLEAQAAAQKLEPLEFVRGVLNDPKSSFERKQWAAATALPYCNPRLTTSQVDLNVRVGLADRLREALQNYDRDQKEEERLLIEGHAIDETTPGAAH
jgi:hypothetical protein